MRHWSAWRFSGMNLVTCAALAFLYLPILTLVVLSFNAGNSAGGAWQGFSLRWYAAIATNADLLRAIGNSLVIASIVTFATTVISTMMALGLTARRFPGQTQLATLMLTPMVVPEIVLAIAMLMFFSRIGIMPGLITIALAHTVLVLPIAYVPIQARLRGLDPALSEAALDLYATPMRRFRRITLPLIAPGIATGAMLAFVGSLSDVVVSYFVSGPGATTLPVYVFGMLRVGITPLINAVSTLLLLASIVLTVAVYLGSRAGSFTNGEPS